jgi:ABC-type sulfate transport system permease component
MHFNMPALCTKFHNLRHDRPQRLLPHHLATGRRRRRQAGRIVLLSLRVSLAATLIACIVGMPIGALLAVGRFPGRRALIVLFNGLMGLPPVVVGLLVYLLLSRAGPLGNSACCSRPRR